MIKTKNVPKSKKETKQDLILSQDVRAMILQARDDVFEELAEVYKKILLPKGR